MGVLKRVQWVQSQSVQSLESLDAFTEKEEDEWSQRVTSVTTEQGLERGQETKIEIWKITENAKYAEITKVCEQREDEPFSAFWSFRSFSVTVTKWNEEWRPSGKRTERNEEWN